MIKRPASKEAKGIAYRIEEHLGAAASDAERREVALTWGGYCAGLLEWGVLTPGEYGWLYKRLEPYLSSEGPLKVVFLGLDDDEEQAEREAPAAAE